MKHLKKFNENKMDGLQFTIDDFEDVMQLQWEKYKGLEKLYKIVDIEVEDTDIGKGIINANAIIERLSDGRFFKFEYSHDEGRNPLSIGGLANPRTMIGVEVYPHTVTKVVYKTKPKR